ncbi:CRISPR-associated endonuclease Cas2 [Rhodocaloribacter sp.]
MRSPAPYGRRYDLLITYDVETSTRAGRRRLRRVAKLCESYGQRVQYSVFECRLNQAQLETLEHRLVQEIDAETDSVRIYVLKGGREGAIFVYGRDDYRDFDEPLIV